MSPEQDSGPTKVHRGQVRFTVTRETFLVTWPLSTELGYSPSPREWWSVRPTARLSGLRRHPRPYACRPPSASAVCGRASLPWRLLRSVIDSVGAASAEFPTEYLLLKPRAVGSPREYRSSNSARLPLAGRYLQAHYSMASGASSSVSASSLGEQHRGGRWCCFGQFVRPGSSGRDLGRA